MNLKSLVISGCLLAALATLPVASFAAAKSVSAESLVRENMIETLKDLHSTATDASERAATLESLSRTYMADWQEYASQLEALKDDINDMAPVLHKLATGRLSTQAGQIAMARASAALSLMAGGTQSALVDMQENRNLLFMPAYRKYTANLATQAEELAGSLARAIQNLR